MKLTRSNSEFIDEMLADPLFSHLLHDEDHAAGYAHEHHGESGHSHSYEHGHSHEHGQEHAHDHEHGHAEHTGNTPEPVVSKKAEPKPKRRQEADQAQDKVRSTLRSLVRDWSSEGAAERSKCYTPCLEALEKYFPQPSTSTEGAGDEIVRPRNEVRVLVPGCGLARLAMEVAAKGFRCEGNEFSVYMLLASNFILNQ